MEQQVWVLHNFYNGKFLVYDNIDALKTALGSLAIEFWELNGELDECFTDTFAIEKVPLNKTEPEW